MKEVMKAIYNRRSTRSYKPDQISREELAAVLDAGLWAPTARNAQEIIMVTVQDAALLSDIKADYAKNSERGAQQPDYCHSAPTFIFLYGPKEYGYTELDSGIVVENMALAAEGLGLGSVIIGCIREYMNSEAGEKWVKRLGLPENQKFTIGLGLGYKDKETPTHSIKEGRSLII